MHNKHDKRKNLLRKTFQEYLKQGHVFFEYKLPDPVPCGWLRSHTLTKKARNREDADVLLEIQSAISTEQWGRSKVFTARRNKQTVERVQRLRSLSSLDVRSTWRKYFHYKEPIRDDGTFICEFKYPDLFEFEVVRGYQTLGIGVDPAAMSLRHRLRDWLMQNRGLRLRHIIDDSASRQHLVRYANLEREFKRDVLLFEEELQNETNR